MKRYFITLALLLLLLTLLIPSSLPTATAAPSSEAEEEYHPGINAKQLKVYQKAVKTADCGDLPPMACTPDGPNDPGDQEKLIHDRIIPGGTTVDEVTITNNPPTEHYQYEKCGYPAEQWRETNYDQVDLSLGYPPEYSEQPDTIRGYKQGFKDRITITGLWILPPYHHPDCEKALHGTAIEETNLSGRYTLTDAPHSDSDDIADAYDACPSEPGPASNDGCPAMRSTVHSNVVAVSYDGFGNTILPLGSVALKKRVEYNGTTIDVRNISLEPYIPDILQTVGVRTTKVELENQYSSDRSRHYSKWKVTHRLNLNEDTRIARFTIPRTCVFENEHISICVPEVNFPGLRIPKGSYNLGDTYIEVNSLSNGCFYASGQGSSQICPDNP